MPDGESIIARSWRDHCAPSIAARARRCHCASAAPPRAAVWNGAFAACAAQSRNARPTVLGDRPPVKRLCQTCSKRSRSAAVTAPGDGSCIGRTSGSGVWRMGMGISGMARCKCNLQDGDARSEPKQNQKSRNPGNRFDATQIPIRVFCIQSWFGDVDRRSASVPIAAKIVQCHI